MQTKYMLKLSRLAEPTPANVNVAPIASWDHFHPMDYLLTVKGAPEVLLPRCGYVINPSGGPPIPIDQSVLGRISAVQERWAKGGQRVILLARRVITEDLLPKGFDPQLDEFEETILELNADLIIVGLVGLVDPLKPSIPHVVQYVLSAASLGCLLTIVYRTCRRAGIRFFVVTGAYVIAVEDSTLTSHS